MNVNDAYNTFQSLFDNACDQHCPIKEKQIKGSFPEWINGDYIKLCKDRDYYFSRAHKFNNDDDWKMARHLRNKANKLNRSLKKNYCTKAINDNVNNSKMLWNTIKKLIPKIIPLFLRYGLMLDLQQVTKKLLTNLIHISPLLVILWLADLNLMIL